MLAPPLDDASDDYRVAVEALHAARLPYRVPAFVAASIALHAITRAGALGFT